MNAIGSTKKGVGAAMIERIRRSVDAPNIAANSPELSQYVVSTDTYRLLIAEAQDVLVEGAQGYGLSMYHGFYPYTTSRDVSTWQILADVGIPYDLIFNQAWAKDCIFKVLGTCRTYPIRVANRYDENGEQVGYSGPCYTDQSEITFADIGQEQELTTVTKLPRRIFTFSKQQIIEAIHYTGVREVFLNFLNYCKTEQEVIDIVDAIESSGARVKWVSLGPTDADVIDVDYTMRRHRVTTIVESFSLYNKGRNNARY